jgi:transcriptional regulator with XRE-family HTH domain
MEFGEKIKLLRTQKKMSQQTLADKAGISLRSVQNYESGTRHPSNVIIIKDIAAILDTTYDYLLDDKSQYVLDAAERGGMQAALDVDRLISDIQGAFAGGEMSQQDKDKLMRAVNEIYWETKD